MSTINFLTPAQLAALDSDTLATIESVAMRNGYAHGPDVPAYPDNTHDLTTTAGKLAYIGKHGSDAFVAALAALRGDDQSKVADAAYAAWKAKRGSAKPEAAPEPGRDKGLNFM